MLILVVYLLVLAVVYMAINQIKLNKKFKDLSERTAELECRVVVRLEDRITLVENDVAEIERQQFKFEG